MCAVPIKSCIKACHMNDIVLQSFIEMFKLLNEGSRNMRLCMSELVRFIMKWLLYKSVKIHCFVCTQFRTARNPFRAHSPSPRSLRTRKRREHDGYVSCSFEKYASVRRAWRKPIPAICWNLHDMRLLDSYYNSCVVCAFDGNRIERKRHHACAYNILYMSVTERWNLAYTLHTHSSNSLCQYLRDCRHVR